MATIVIPKKLAHNNDLVVISKREYDEFLSMKKLFHAVKSTTQERQTIIRGRKEIVRGRYKSWRVLS